jgi:hypothetical protein
MPAGLFGAARCPQHLKGNTMGMNVGSGSAKGADPEPMMEMNMTPLIDVLLVSDHHDDHHDSEAEPLGQPEHAGGQLRRRRPEAA